MDRRNRKYNIFFKESDGSIRCDLKEIELDNKVLLRSDGTSVYVTQDLGTAIKRREDFKFDRLIYVVASEQDYHFKVLFHLSYGMVILPDGKMKSREGTVVDADSLLESLEELITKEINSRERTDQLEDIKDTANKIALGALHLRTLCLTQRNLYHLQETRDLICNILLQELQVCLRNLVKMIFPVSILNSSDKDLAVTRIELSKAVLQVLKNTFQLLNIPCSL